jgi:hypothetical protein
MFMPSFTSSTLIYASPAMPLQDYHPLRSDFPDGSRHYWLIRFRSPLLTESRLLSFPLGTEMFQFSRFTSHTYAFSVR